MPENNCRHGQNSKPHIYMCINIHRNYISLVDFKSFSPGAWRGRERLLKPYKSPGLENLTFQHLSAYNTIFNSGFNENVPSGSIYCQKTWISSCILTAERGRRKQMGRRESEICEMVWRWQVEIHPKEKGFKILLSDIDHLIVCKKCWYTSSGHWRDSQSA